MTEEDSVVVDNSSETETAGAESAGGPTAADAQSSGGPTQESSSPTVEVPIETPPPELAPVPVEATTTAPDSAPPSLSVPSDVPMREAGAQTGLLLSVRDLILRGHMAVQDRKRKKRDKIMQALATKTKITNDEVEKLLHVSDPTATRYLAALVKEGKIKKENTGSETAYTKI